MGNSSGAARVAARTTRRMRCAVAVRPCCWVSTSRGARPASRRPTGTLPRRTRRLLPDSLLQPLVQPLLGPALRALRRRTPRAAVRSPIAGSPIRQGHCVASIAIGNSAQHRSPRLQSRRPCLRCPRNCASPIGWSGNCLRPGPRPTCSSWRSAPARSRASRRSIARASPPSPACRNGSPRSTHAIACNSIASAGPMAAPSKSWSTASTARYATCCVAAPSRAPCCRSSSGSSTAP